MTGVQTCALPIYCQIELRDIKGAKATLADLMKTYPKSEAAVAGRERLASLK